MHPRLIASILLPLISVVAVPASGDDWPQWRGPAHNGISAETDWAGWGDGKPKIAWEAQAGLGFSSFVVAKGKVITVGYGNDADTVLCLDVETGKTLWQHSYPSEQGAKFFEGGTTGTPTIAGDRVYSLSRWGDAFCLDLATGKPVWSVNIQKDHGVRIPSWGFGGAPLVHDNLVIYNAGETGIALEKDTGKLAWKSANKDAGYSTPYLTKIGDKTLAIFSSSLGYAAVDPATGKEAWRVRWVTQFGVNAADPIIDGDRMYISSGYGKGGALFDLSGDPPKELWKSKVLRTQMNPAVLFQGHLYGVDGDTTEKATLKCVELATGAEKWVHPDFGSGTVIIAGDKLIALSAAGELSIAPATPDGFKPTASAKILDGKCWTVPVLSDGRLFCRNWKGKIVCVDLRK